MRPGKVPPDILQRIVFTKLGSADPDVLLGPRLGEDASVISMGDKVILAATDPVTGSIADVGWLAVHVNANDIAAFGVRPRWFLASIMLPESSTTRQLERIMKQIDEAAQILGIAVAGGHSEITVGIGRPIVVGFMIGLTDRGKYVTSSGAKPGNSIIVTKSIALEGSAILATEGKEYLTQKVGAKLVARAKSLRENISVVSEGLAAYETGYVTAMHDPTEGGLSGGLHEISDASDVGFEIYQDAIPIDESSRIICEVLDINPMELISSGSMIVCCSSTHATDVVNMIQSRGIPACIIGKVMKDSDHRILVTDSECIALPQPKTDSLWAALKRINS
jgi:hydrogenase expression/formation protein HypE